MFIGNEKEPDLDELFPCFITDDEEAPHSMLTPSPPQPSTLFYNSYNQVPSNATLVPSLNRRNHVVGPPVMTQQHPPSMYYDDEESDQDYYDPIPKPLVLQRQASTQHHQPFVPDTRYSWITSTSNREEEEQLLALQREILSDVQIINKSMKESEEPALPPVQASSSNSSISSIEEEQPSTTERKEVKEEGEEGMEEPEQDVAECEEEEGGFWKNKSDPQTWEELNSLFMANQQHQLIPLPPPPSTTQTPVITPDPPKVDILIAPWEEEEYEKETQPPETNKTIEQPVTQELPLPPPPSTPVEQAQETTPYVMVMEEKDEEVTEEEEDEEELEEIEIEQEPPTDRQHLSYSTFENYAIAEITPISVKIMIEYVQTTTTGRLVWGWPYKEWPICAWLEFEFPSGRTEVFETRMGDKSVHMGAQRYESGECQSLDLLNEGIIDAKQCVILYMRCKEFQRDLESVHYDVICEYINTIPRYGKKFAAWWRQYVRKENTKYITSHQLVFLVLSSAFPHFGTNRQSAFYSITDFFIYMMELKSNFASSSSSSSHQYYEDIVGDPYASEAASSSSVSRNPCKEEV